MSSTSHELAKAREHYRSRVIRPEDLATMDEETRRLEAEDVLGKMLKPGMRAPDFLLPDVDGKAVSLCSLVAAGPTVLVFYRGGWCPYCNIHLRGLQAVLGRIRGAGASLAAISPQLPDGSLTTAEKNGLEFPVLSDVGNHVAGQFGIMFRLSETLSGLYETFGHGLREVNGETGREHLPVPSVFVIGSDRIVRWAMADIDYTRRLDPEDLLAQLERDRKVKPAEAA